MRPRSKEPPPAPSLAEISPQFPDLLDYLWQWFQELSLGIAPTGFGPAVITWETLRSWREIMGIDLEAWEARALVMLGMLRASIAAESTRTERSTTAPPRTPPTIGGRRFAQGAAIG